MTPNEAEKRRDAMVAVARSLVAAGHGARDGEPLENEMPGTDGAVLSMASKTSDGDTSGVE